MPLIPQSSYKVPTFLRNGHMMTIYANIKRKESHQFHSRIRHKTKDHDFFDVDILCHAKSNKAVCIQHGLEGSSRDAYISSLAKELFAAGFDVYCMNFRSCSGVPNLKKSSYHSCFTQDLDELIQKVILPKKKYESIYLSGFSLGGNLTLHYLGAQQYQVPKQVKGAVVFSVPVSLGGCAKRMAEFDNRIYMLRFMNSFEKKINEKRKSFSDLKKLDRKNIQTFVEYDREYTAPLSGFKSEAHYYNFCSSIYVLHSIQVPTLIVNAKDDPFLSSDCFPYGQCKDSANVFLETPDHGGHCGFLENYSAKHRSFINTRTLDFFSQIEE